MGHVCCPQHRTVELPPTPIPRRVSLQPAPQPPRTPQNTQCLHCARTRRMAVRVWGSRSLGWDRRHYSQACSILGTMVDKTRACAGCRAPYSMQSSRALNPSSGSVLPTGGLLFKYACITQGFQQTCSTMHPRLIRCLSSATLLCPKTLSLTPAARRTPGMSRHLLQQSAAVW